MIKFSILGNTVHSDPLQIAFSIGNFQVHWYSITYLLGFLLAIIVGCLKLHYYYKVSYEPFFWFAIMAIPGAIFGARSWSYIIGDAKFNTTDTWLAFKEFFGAAGTGGMAGLAILGGVIFDIIIALIYFPLILRRPKYNVRVSNDIGLETLKKVSIWIYADAIVPLIVLGQAIGRWGNFANHEVFGDLTPVSNIGFLAYMMPEVFKNMYIIPQQYNIVGDVPKLANFYQPFFLYESFGDIILWFIIYFGMERIIWLKRGSLACAYFIGYGIIRSSMETERYGFNFLDSEKIPSNSNGYEYNGYSGELMKFGFDKDYITACAFIIFGFISLVFVNLYVFKMRSYNVWKFLLQKIQYPLVNIFYRIKLRKIQKLKTKKNKKISNSVFNNKIDEIKKKIEESKQLLNPIKKYSRIKDLKYYYADFDSRNN